MDPRNGNEHAQQLNPLVTLTGTALEGSIGPSLGVMDIGVSDDAYLVRIALPGIRRPESNLKCDVKVDGTIVIRGVVRTDTGILKDTSSVFQMRVQQLSPPGPFSISFRLPGPVDGRLFSPNFRSDGILELVIRKSGPPGPPPGGLFHP